MCRLTLSNCGMPRKRKALHERYPVAAAANIKPERRDVYLQRVEAMLKVRGIFDDGDVRDVAQLALCGLTTRKQTDAA